jgi:hypothetical protein
LVNINPRFETRIEWPASSTTKLFHRRAAAKGLDQHIDRAMTTSVRTVERAIPPIIETATRCMISDPTPALQRIGTSPAMLTPTVSAHI